MPLPHIADILGIAFGLFFAILWLVNRPRPPLPRRRPRTWPHCPFCAPVPGLDGRLYRQSALVGNANEDGESWRWAWCSRCGAAMFGHEWHAPDPTTLHGYRGTTVAETGQGDTDGVTLAKGESDGEA